MTTKKELLEVAALLTDTGMIVVSIDYKAGTLTVKPIPVKR